MQSFSERQGLKPVKSVIQLDSIDDSLRTALWNALEEHYWPQPRARYLANEDNKDLLTLCKRLWDRHFKRPIDTIKVDGEWKDTHHQIRAEFFAADWHEVYDFMEMAARSYPIDEKNAAFREGCNKVMERELSGYRFIGGMITPVTSHEEIAEIEQALELPEGVKHVSQHIESALALLADRESPDYRNSIKESISAVEAICKAVTNDPKATLGQALKVIRDRLGLHPALEGAFDKLYGYTSDADGIRHALLEEDDLKSEDARFMLVACSAFVNYLVAKASTANVNF